MKNRVMGERLERACLRLNHPRHKGEESRVKALGKKWLMADGKGQLFMVCNILRFRAVARRHVIWQRI